MNSSHFYETLFYYQLQERNPNEFPLSMSLTTKNAQGLSRLHQYY